MKKFLNKKCNSVRVNLTNSLVCVYHSNNIIYNLPSMKNCIKSGDKPNLHIIFGETIAQLVSISFSTEALFYINLLIQNNSLDSNIRETIINTYLESIPNIENILFDKNLLESTINNILNNFLIKITDLVLEVYSNKLDSSEKMILKNYFNFQFTDLKFFG